MTRIITTEDGSHTIYVPELKEHYHSVHGAIQESEHVFILNGLDYCNTNPLNILEIGFGTGLNTFLTAFHNLNTGRQIYYTAIEKYPVKKEILNTLNYPTFYGPEGQDIFKNIHTSPWGNFHQVCQDFLLKKIRIDLVSDEITDSYNLIYFDAFAPDKQPEMWTIEIFHKIAEVSEDKAILVTYSAKGEVKRNLRSCGYKVTLLPGPPGKRHITRAIKS